MTWTDLELLGSLFALIYFSRLFLDTWRSPEFRKEVERYRETRRRRKAARRY
jgi:hypothetical protein